MKRWKFENIFAFAILIVLFLALVGAFWIGSTDLVNMLVVAFVGALGTITAFFFKDDHKEGEKKDGQ